MFTAEQSGLAVPYLLHGGLPASSQQHGLALPDVLWLELPHLEDRVTSSPGPGLTLASRSPYFSTQKPHLRMSLPPAPTTVSTRPATAQPAWKLTRHSRLA